MGLVQHVGAFGTAVERSGACNVRVTKKREILGRAGLQHVIYISISTIADLDFGVSAVGFR